MRVIQNIIALNSWPKHVGGRVVPNFSIFTGYLVDASSTYLYYPIH